MGISLLLVGMGSSPYRHRSHSSSIGFDSYSQELSSRLDSVTSKARLGCPQGKFSHKSLQFWSYGLEGILIRVVR